MCLTAYFQDRYSVDRPLEKNSVVNYQITARMFDNWLRVQGVFGISIGDIDLDLINLFLRDYGKDKSAYSVACKRKHIVAMVNHYLAPFRRTVESKFIRSPKKPETIKDTWSPAEVSALIAACYDMGGDEFLCTRFTRTKRADYLAAVFQFVWETACRRGDLPRVRISDVKDGRPFSFIQNKTKTLVTFRITEPLRKKILSLPHVIEQNTKFAFPLWGLAAADPRMLSDMALRALNASGLSTSDGTFKKLRRSSITDVERRSPGVAYLHAGHSTPEITRDHYIDKSRAYGEIQRPTPLEVTPQNLNEEKDESGK